jgi:hypothetical protein
VNGQNPYDKAVLAKALRAAGREVRNDGKVDFTEPVYPPTVLLLLSPLSGLTWTQARAVWLGLNLLLYLAAAWASLQIVSLRGKEPCGLLFWFLILVAGPIHTNFSNGQVGVAAAAFAILGIFASHRKSDVAAGVLFSLSIALKPHLAGLLLLHFIVRGRWRMVVATAVSGSILGAVAFSRLYLHQPQAIHNLLLTWINPGPRVAELDPAGALSYQMIHLAPLLHRFIENSAVVDRIVLLFAGIGLLGWLVLIRRVREESSELISLSVLATYSLLVVYHRFYDVIILMPCLAWSLKNISGPLRSVSRWVLVALAPFLVSGAAFLQVVAERGFLPKALVEGFWWRTFLLPHQIWALLVLFCVLLVALSRQTKQGPRLEADGRS